MKKFLTLVILMVIFKNSNIYAGVDGYKQITDKNHDIHVLKINRSSYTAKIVKANDGKPGRETLSSLAKRHNASFAINGGFFEIGGSTDGEPSFSLVIGDKVYKQTNKSQPLVLVESGDLSLDFTNPTNIKSKMSLVSGFPMLLVNGKIPEYLHTKTSGFYLKAHARTAIGIDKENNLIIVIADHYYSRDLYSFTMGELYSLLKEKGDLLTKQYNKQDYKDLTLNEIRSILKDEFSSDDKANGLTIIELANLMQKLGCETALNLDGGGSSTLWIDGEVVNSPIGDVDESEGKKIERPIGDAILFFRKN